MIRKKNSTIIYAAVLTVYRRIVPPIFDSSDEHASRNSADFCHLAFPGWHESFQRMFRTGATPKIGISVLMCNKFRLDCIQEEIEESYVSTHPEEKN